MWWFISAKEQLQHLWLALASHSELIESRDRETRGLQKQVTKLTAAVAALQTELSDRKIDRRVKKAHEDGRFYDYSPKITRQECHEFFLRIAERDLRRAGLLFEPVVEECTPDLPPRVSRKKGKAKDGRSKVSKVRR